MWYNFRTFCTVSHPPPMTMTAVAARQVTSCCYGRKHHALARVQLHLDRCRGKYHDLAHVLLLFSRHAVARDILYLRERQVIMSTVLTKTIAIRPRIVLTYIYLGKLTKIWRATYGLSRQHSHLSCIQNWFHPVLIKILKTSHYHFLPSHITSWRRLLSTTYVAVCHDHNLYGGTVPIHTAANKSTFRQIDVAGVAIQYTFPYVIGA